jgi:hypothetical protein
MFEYRVLRRIFGPKEDDVTGGWRKLHNEEHRDLCSSLSIIRIIKSRRMRWAEHVTQMGGRETLTGYNLGKAEGKRSLRLTCIKQILFGHCAFGLLLV